MVLDIAKKHNVHPALVRGTLQSYFVTQFLCENGVHTPSVHVHCIEERSINTVLAGTLHYIVFSLQFAVCKQLCSANALLHQVHECNIRECV